jgi:hypothetical protein
MKVVQQTVASLGSPTWIEPLEQSDGTAAVIARWRPVSGRLQIATADASRVLRHRVRTLAMAVLVCVAMSGRAAHAQEADPPQPQSPHRAATVATFLAGGGLAFAIHEGGHLTFDVIFDAQPRVRAVHFGPIPFFAITPARPLSPRQLFTVASAGFWTQAVTTEILLPRETSLREAHAPFVKGMLAFDILTSIGYAVVAFAGAGPPERDTRGMANGLGVPEPVVGVVVLAPAALEAYRYFSPRSTWAKWASWAVGAGSVALVFIAPPSHQR